MYKRLLILCLPIVFISGAVSAQDDWVNINQQVTGEELFPVCAICHGTQGQGNDRRDGPALAGLPPWYIEKQLHNFRNGVRGYSEEDVPGQFMSGVKGMLRNAETIKSLADYISILEPGADPDANAIGSRPFVWHSPYAGIDASITGDVEAGAKTFTGLCAACHQADASGNEALGAGNLQYLSKIYMERQLMYFRDSLRGAQPEDTTGQQMAGMAKTLTDDQAIADVVAYILSLREEGR
jgi:cytochrome c oxidase subunit II